MSKPIDEGISRREALQGGSAAAVAVGAGLLSNQLVRRAQAASSGDPRILMGDAATSPDEAGEAVRNGADWEFYSGGAVRNLTTPNFDSGTQIAGNPAVGIPDSSTSISLSFGTWRSISSPTFVVVETISETDGSSGAAIDFEIDESGGTSADTTIRLNNADSNLGSGGKFRLPASFLLSDGVSYRIVNVSDPNSGNQILSHEEWVLA